MAKSMKSRAVVSVGADQFEIELPSKEFKSGNEGFWNQQRVALSDGRSASIQVTVVIKG